MNIKRLFVNWLKYYFLAIPLFIGFFIKECFIRDIYKSCVEYLEDITETEDSELGFFFIIKNTELSNLKISFRLKFLVIVKFWKYALKELKKKLKRN